MTPACVLFNTCDSLYHSQHLRTVADCISPSITDDGNSRSMAAITSILLYLMLNPSLATRRNS